MFFGHLDRGQHFLFGLLGLRLHLLLSRQFREARRIERKTQSHVNLQFSTEIDHLAIHGGKIFFMFGGKLLGSVQMLLQHFKLGANFVDRVQKSFAPFQAEQLLQLWMIDAKHPVFVRGIGVCHNIQQPFDRLMRFQLRHDGGQHLRGTFVVLPRQFHEGNFPSMRLELLQFIRGFGLFDPILASQLLQFQLPAPTIDVVEQVFGIVRISHGKRRDDEFHR